MATILTNINTELAINSWQNSERLIRWNDSISRYVVAYNDGSTQLKIAHVTQDGSGVVSGIAGPTVVSSQQLGSLFCDASGDVWVSYSDNADTYVAHGVWDGSSSYSWVTNNVSTNSSSWSEVVAFADPNNAGDYVAFLMFEVGFQLNRYSILWDSSAGTLSSSFVGIDNASSPGIAGFDLDFKHTGDGITLSGSSPEVYTAWIDDQANTLFFRKYAWNGAWNSWSQFSVRTIDSTVSIVSDVPVSVIFDGSDAYIFGWDVDDLPRLWKRDGADTVTSVVSDPTALPTNGVLITQGVLRDTTTDDMFFVAVADSSAGTGSETGELWYAKIDASNSYAWGTWTQITTDLYKGGSSFGWSFALDAHSGLGFTVIWEAEPTNTTDGFVDIDFEVVEDFNSLPTAPTVDSPSDGSTQDINETLTIDWTFNDPDAGDTQSSYTLRRRVGAGSFEYWNGSAWQAGEDATTKIATATTQQTLAATWGTDGDGDHYYSVKTWDAADAGPSPWSSEIRVVPSAQDNPTLTAPADLASVGAQETATWTVATQTKYRVVVSDTSSASDMDAGTLEYDSGIQVSASTNQAITFPTNSVTRYVRVQTWNDEGLASDIDEHQVSVAFTPPATPTLVVTAGSPTGAIGVSITNPGTGATEESNDIYRRVVGSSGDGIRVATGVAVDGSFTDWAVASGVAYEYRAKAFGDNGTTAFSAWTP